MEAPGIESPATSEPIVADRRGNDAGPTTVDDAEPLEVSASPAPRTSATSVDTDAAIRAAAKIAIDSGDYRKARALLDVLSASSATVTPLAAVRSRKA